MRLMRLVNIKQTSTPPSPLGSGELKHQDLLNTNLWNVSTLTLILSLKNTICVIFAVFQVVLLH